MQTGLKAKGIQKNNSMKINTVTYQKAFVIGPYLQEKVGIEVQLDEGESPDTVLDIAKGIVETWHRAANKELYDQLGTVTVTREPVAHDPEIDQAFERLKETLAIIKYREEAQAFLDSTEFKHTIEAKKIVNSKPTKP